MLGRAVRSGARRTLALTGGGAPLENELLTALGFARRRAPPRRAQPRRRTSRFLRAVSRPTRRHDREILERSWRSIRTRPGVGGARIPPLSGGELRERRRAFVERGKIKKQSQARWRPPPRVGRGGRGFVFAWDRGGRTRAGSHRRSARRAPPDSARARAARLHASLGGSTTTRGRLRKGCAWTRESRPGSAPGLSRSRRSGAGARVPAHRSIRTGID